MKWLSLTKPRCIELPPSSAAARGSLPTTRAAFASAMRCTLTANTVICSTSLLWAVFLLSATSIVQDYKLQASHSSSIGYPPAGNSVFNKQTICAILKWERRWQNRKRHWQNSPGGEWASLTRTCPQDTLSCLTAIQQSQGLPVFLPVKKRELSVFSEPQRCFTARLSSKSVDPKDNIPLVMGMWGGKRDWKVQDWNTLHPHVARDMYGSSTEEWPADTSVWALWRHQLIWKENGFPETS